MHKPIFFLSLFFFSCTGQKKINTTAPFAANPVVAHRGAFKKNSFPENSIAALREAIRLQCTGSEFDVRMTADDSLIINHDPHYHKLEIEKTLYSQLAAIPLKNGEPLPTLRQYLQAGLNENRHTRLVLEIKPSGISKERGKRIAEKCAALVKETGAEQMTVYISFDYDILKKIRELDKHAVLQYLNGDVAPEQIRKDGMNGIDYNLSVFRLHPEWIEDSRKNKIALNAWTVNERKDMEWLLDKGFDFITTNEPELLFEVLEARRQSK